MGYNYKGGVICSHAFLYNNKNIFGGIAMEEKATVEKTVVVSYETNDFEFLVQNDELYLDFRCIYDLLNMKQQYSNWALYKIHSLKLVENVDYLHRKTYKHYFYASQSAAIKIIIQKKDGDDFTGLIGKMFTLAESKLAEVNKNYVLNTKKQTRTTTIKQPVTTDNPIIAVYEQNNRKMVNGRELHSFLRVRSRFADWIRYKIKKYDFIPNKEFVVYYENLPGGGRSTEYSLTLQMAKELAMLENNAEGKRARRYFLCIEEDYKKITSNNQKVINNNQKIEEEQLLPEVTHILDEISDLKNRIKQIEFLLPTKESDEVIDKKIYTYTEEQIAERMELFTLNNRPHTMLIKKIAEELDLIECGDNFNYNSDSYKEPIFYKGKIVGKRIFFSENGALKIKNYLLKKALDIFTISYNSLGRPIEIICKIPSSNYNYHLRFNPSLYNYIKTRSNK